MKPSACIALTLAVALIGCTSSTDAQPDDEDVGGGATNAADAAPLGHAAGADGGRTTGTGGRSAVGTGGASGNGAGGTGNPGTGGQYPTGSWVNATGNLANVSTVCGNSYRVWGVPHADKMLAGISRVGVYATTDGGAIWTLQGGSASPNNDQNDVTFDPEHPDVYWVAGMHVNAGVWKTTDGGTSFTPMGDIGNIDGVSVDFTDARRQTIVAGTHEQHVIYKSTDGGASYEDITASFPPGRGITTAPIVIDANTYVMGTVYYSSDPNEGVFRTSDGGASWSQVRTVGVGGVGLKTSWGPLFYGTRAGGNVLKGSADGSTWATLPVKGGRGYSIVIELPGKRIATTARNGNVNSIVMSGDEGATWTTIADKIPAPSWWNPFVGPYLAYDEVRGAFFVSYSDCGTVVHSDAIWRYDVMISG
jgi:hypothetical protein